VTTKSLFSQFKDPDRLHVYLRTSHPNSRRPSNDQGAIRQKGARNEMATRLIEGTSATVQASAAVCAATGSLLVLATPVGAAVMLCVGMGALAKSYTTNREFAHQKLARFIFRPVPDMFCGAYAREGVGNVLTDADLAVGLR
jgi:hypothetical protein